MRSLSLPNRIDLKITLVAVVLALAFLGTLHLAAWDPTSDMSVDAPYHITMADLFPQIAVQRTFPHMARSVWRDTFYDKELAFHGLLHSLRKWAGLLGYDPEPPFVLESFALVTLCMAVFWALLHHLGVRTAYLFVPIFLFGFPFFTMRLNLVRPHVLSIALMLGTVGLLCSAAPLGRKRLWQFGLLGLAFAYCHSNPHFMLLPTAVFALVYFPRHRWRALWPTWAALGGILAGLILHPQFPNTFIIWKIQCVDVILAAVMKAVPEITTPAELDPPTRRHLLHNLLLPLIPVSIAAAAWIYRRSRPFDRRFWFIFSLACITVAGYFVSKRTIEYAAPFATLAAALAYQRLLGHRSRRLHLSLLAAVALGAFSLRGLYLQYFNSARLPIPLQFAEWARASLPPGTHIANLRWDDFPRLFYAAPEFVYSYGLDPMFAYRAHPEDFLRVERFSTNKEPFPPAAEMKQIVGSRFVFVSFAHSKAARRMAERGYALAYQGTDGWCFDLDAPAVDHRLEQRRTPQTPG